MEKTLFLIDGNSLLNRAYYALPPLTTVSGEPTNAIYGFTMMLFRLLDDYNPTQICVAFDVSAPTFRHEAYKEYKANRKGMPDDLRVQMDGIKQVLDAWGILRLELAGYEADDIIGTAAKKGEALGYKVYIVTGDRDALQLISEQTNVLLTKRGIKEIEVMDLNRLAQEYQLKPEQIIDLKGLMGDTSDNIPGVPGVGKKTALRLLKDYHSIDKLYEEIEQEKGKLKQRLIENYDQAVLSKKLATIDCQVPLKIDFSADLNKDDDELVEIFSRLEFNSLLERIISKDKKESGKTAAENLEFKVNILKKHDLPELAQELAATENIAVYLTHRDLAAASQDSCWYISKDLIIDFISLLGEINSHLSIYTNDAKALSKFSVEAGCDLNVLIDTTLAGYVLDPNGSLDLSALSVRYGGLSPLMELEDNPECLALKAKRVLELAPKLKERLIQDDLMTLYQEIELPLAKVLAKMETRGIFCNPTTLKQLSDEMKKALDKLTREIIELAGEEFNINSPKQLGKILFEKLGLPVIKRTKTGPSTNAEVLEQLSFHPIVAKVLEFRQLNKLKSTYTDALGELIDEKTGRIHTTFNQTVTATGRLSSANPNLQNIPIRTPEGRRIRGAFESKPDWYLLAADYSQIELRVLAHISNDEGMIDAFNSGADIHARTASEVFQIPLDKVTPSDREAAKAINFGIVYGISSFGLAKGTNLSRTKAQQYIDLYFKRYPKVKSYLDEIVKKARKQGYVTTILNRRRYLPDINSRNYTRRSFAERMAMNSPIQGSAADIIKIAMLKIDQRLSEQNYQARMLLQVHDELVFEVPEEELAAIAQLVKKEMESAMDLAVKLKVDLKVGRDWESVKQINEV